MASTITEIDNYLKKNKKQFFAMLNSHWGKNDDDAKQLKYLWNNAQDAKGINNKIASFNKLKEKLNPYIQKAEKRLPGNEKILEENGIEKFAYPEDQLTLEMDRMFTTLSNFPRTNELDDLTIDHAYSQNYNYNQMKELASQYGYDYTDKEERNDFLKLLSEYERERQLDKIWSEDKYTSFVTPIAKEYARKNFDKIDSFGDLAPALAADVGVNTLMAGAGGYGASKIFNNPVARNIAVNAVDNTVAPIARAGANMALNDKSLGEAAYDAGNEIATNIATPYMLRGGYRWFGRMTPTMAVRQGAKDVIDQTANKVRDIEKALDDGAVFQSFGGNGKKYYTLKNGNLQEISNAEAAKAPYFVKPGDYEFYKKYRGMKLGTKADKSMEDMYKVGAEAKFDYNLQNEKPRFEGMDPYEIAAVANVKPKERKFNWAKHHVPESFSNYITNAQGRSKYAGTMFSQISKLDPTQSLQPEDLQPTPKLSDKDKAELEFYKRLSDLHTKHPDLIGQPKLPDKFKKYKDDLTIQSIFGEIEE